METNFIGVRDVDKETFKKFRALAIKEKLKLGKTLTLAMKKMLKEKRDRKEFMKFAGVFAKNREKWDKVKENLKEDRKKAKLREFKI